MASLRGCGTCAWLAERPAKQQETFAELVARTRDRARPDWTIGRLLACIQEDGYPFEYAALNRHLLGYYKDCRGAR